MDTTCGRVSTGCARNNDQSGATGECRRPWQTITGLWLHLRLDPYVKNMKVWMCPSLSNATPTATSQEIGYISALSWCQSVPRVTLQNVPEAQLLLTPAQIPFFGDAVAYKTDGYTGCRLISFGAAPLAGSHNDQVNVGFLDGHVKSMAVRAYWDMANKSYSGVSGYVWR